MSAGTHIVALEAGDGLEPLLLDVLLEVVHQLGEAVGYRPQEGVHVGEVTGAFRAHHGARLGVHRCQVVGHHAVLHLLHHTLMRAAMHQHLLSPCLTTTWLSLFSWQPILLLGNISFTRVKIKN